MINKLNQINFNKLLILDTDIDSYDFNVYKNNGKHIIKDFCTKCEDKGCNICPTDDNFRLQNISHGATTWDFLTATHQQDTDLSKWKDAGVIFLMEGPSRDYGLYEEMNIKGFNKKPTKKWYWVDDKSEKLSYPQEFKGGRYGTLFNSIIFTFKLKKAYLTNFIKCGMNSSDDKYKGIDNYADSCIKICIENYLLKEIDIINPKIIFCFGSKVEKKLLDICPDAPFLICGLPHPARQKVGFKDEYYRHLYFTRILEGLYRAKIVDINEAKDKFKDFLSLAQ